MDQLELNIAKEFTRTPGPRYVWEGAFSGETFRKELLLPRLKEAISRNMILEVNLDFTAGYGTSFLEEAFGGLVRHEGVSKDDVVRFIRVRSNEEPELKDDIIAYVNEAEAEG